MPADPEFTVMRDDIMVDVPTFPTVTVFIVPVAGGVKLVTRVRVVGV
jgi:hypothetical protein